MKGLAVAIGLFAVASACANLPDVTPGVCGNGVIEPGEDCDGGSDCDHCSLVCAPDGSCKDGYACGYDHLCHAPSGVFQQTATHTFEFPDFAGVSADVNDDGIPDVIAVSTTSMTVTLGDPHGDLSQQMTQTSPRIGDPGAFTARALGQGQAEVLFATPDGLAGYTAENQQLLPFPFANDVDQAFQACAFLRGGTVHPIGALPFDGHRVTGIARDQSDGQVYVVVVDVVAGTCGAAKACDLTSSDLAPVVLGDTYLTTSITGGIPSEIAVVAVAKDVQHPVGNACVVRANLAGGAIQVDAPAASIPTNGTPPVLARLSGAACPWLVIGGGRADSGMPDAGVTATAPTAPDAIGCNVGTTKATITGGIGPYANPTGHIPLAPPIAGQGPDAIALVTGDGAQGASAIVSVDPPAGGTTAAHAMFVAPTPLTSITWAALEGDPTRISGIAGTPSDVEILRRPGGAATFSAYSIPTAGFTKFVIAGDFDANGYPDIAYVEHLADGDRAMIAYGTPDLVLSPVELAKFTDVIRLLPVDTPDSNDPSNVIPDLAVLDLPGTLPPQPPTLTVFHGSPQRTLRAYYDPRSDRNTSFAGLVTGNFLGHDPSSGIQDVLALEEPSPTDPILKNMRVYAIPGLASPELGDAPGVFDADGLGFEGCGQPGTLLCADTAIFEPWPLANREVAIGFDATGHVATIDPVQKSIVASTPGEPPLEVPGLRGIFDASLSGTRQLFVLFGTHDFATFKGNVLVCDVSATGTVTACQDLATHTRGLDGSYCNDAATGPLTPRGHFDPPPPGHGDDLVALCHPGTCIPGDPMNSKCGTVWRISPDGAGYTASPVLDKVDAQVMILTDVTGDAVPDLLLLSIGGDIPVMQIFPQCEARDLACRTENAR